MPLTKSDACSTLSQNWECSLNLPCTTPTESESETLRSWYSKYGFNKLSDREVSSKSMLRQPEIAMKHTFHAQLQLIYVFTNTSDIKFQN